MYEYHWGSFETVESGRVAFVPFIHIYLYIYLFKSFSCDGFAQLFITGTEPSDNGEGFAFIKESHRKF